MTRRIKVALVVDVVVILTIRPVARALNQSKALSAIERRAAPDLISLMAHPGEFTEDQVVAFVTQVSMELGEIHRWFLPGSSRGVVHRFEFKAGQLPVRGEEYGLDGLAGYSGEIIFEYDSLFAIRPSGLVIELFAR